MKTDSQLQSDVMDEMVWDPSIDHAHIGMAAKGGVVTLSGSSVASESDRPNQVPG